jgi:hypothetical protein
VAELKWLIPLFIIETSTVILWRIYLSVDPVFQILWFLSGFPLKRVVANNEATETSLPNG